MLQFLWYKILGQYLFEYDGSSIYVKESFLWWSIVVVHFPHFNRRPDFKVFPSRFPQAESKVSVSFFFSLQVCQHRPGASDRRLQERPPSELWAGQKVRQPGSGLFHVDNEQNNDITLSVVGATTRWRCYWQEVDVTWEFSNKLQPCVHQVLSPEVQHGSYLCLRFQCLLPLT